MNRSELVRTLELIKPALATTNMVPVFQSFIFDQGTVAAYNDSIAIVGPSEFEVPCGIHGLTLLGLLSNSSVEEFDVKFDKEIITLKLGKTVSKLPFNPEENFIFKEPTDKWAAKVPINTQFIEALTMCLETVSVDTTQTALLGITLQGDKIYSCDSDSLTRVKLKQGAKGRVLMSTQFCLAVAKLWSTLDMVKGTLSISDDWLYADFDVWAVYGRILEVSDPIDFEALIKKTIKAQTPTQALPDGLSEALSRARVLADPESQKTFLSIEKGKMNLHTETYMGEISDTLTFKEHPDVDANVNASHLQRAIQYCDQIAVHDNCVVLEKAPDVLLLMSNMN